MKNLLVIAFVLIINCCLAQSSASEMINLANEHYMAQEYQKAIPIYKQLLKADTTNTDVLYKIGTAAQRLGDFKTAKDYLLRMEKVDTISHSYARPLASIYEIEDNAAKAIKYYSRISKLHPDNALYFRKLGQQYFKAGETGDAFTNFSKAYTLNEKDFFTIQGLSDIFFVNKQYGDADKVLRKALAYDQENIKIQMIYAGSKYKQAQYDTSAMVLYSLRGKVDFNNYYNKMLGYSLMQIDSTEQAVRYLRKSLVNEGNPEIAHYYLARAYEDMEDLEYATHHLEKAIESGITKNIKSYHSNLARLLEQEGDKRGAIKHYESALRYSGDPIFLFYLGRLTDDYYKDKNVAIRYYDRFAQSKHENINYKKYAVDRKVYLREQQHFNNSK